jgi:hypothetical protein
MPTSLKARLAQAHGINSRHCHLALNEINRLEGIIHKCHQAALPDPHDERNIDIEWLTRTILDMTRDDYNRIHTSFKRR